MFRDNPSPVEMNVADAQANSQDEAENRKPFYLRDSSTREEIETQISILSPTEREEYGELESTVSEQFVAAYGQFLNEEQKEYWLERQMIYTAPELAHAFVENWKTDVDAIDPETSNIEGRIFESYEIGTVDTTHQGTPISTPTHHLLAGRFIMHPILPEPSRGVSVQWLSRGTDPRTNVDVNESEEDVKRRWENLRSYRRTNSTGTMIIHEKVHGIQDLALPLPALEAAAYYYERDMAERCGWDHKLFGNTDKLADLYNEFVQKIGGDAHRLIFGNVTDQRQQSELVAHLKKIFTLDTIAQASSWNEDDRWPEPRKHIRWQSISVAEAGQRLKRNQTHS